MALLIASVSESDPTQMIRAADAAWADGAEAVELRIDALGGNLAPIADHLRANPDRQWIITCRSAEEGGRFNGTATEKAARLRQVASDTRACVDIELAEWEQHPQLREIVSAPEESSDRLRLILSAHRFDGPPEQPTNLIDRMLAVPGAVAKLAFTAGDAMDGLIATDLMQQYGRRVIAVAMGDDGLWTRILAKKLGAFGTFCSPAPDTATAPGQLSLTDMLGRFRWKRLDWETRVFGLIGNPVSHSLSPILFNHWFDQFGINAVYIPLHIGRDSDRVGRFLDACAQRPWLEMGGFSVTVPHKEAVLRRLGDSADYLARSIGAVNTVCIQDGEAVGYNTDCYAAVDSLATAIGCDRADFPGISVDVLGAGGAARAIVAGLREFGCPVTVYARTPEKAAALADTFTCSSAQWEDRPRRQGMVLINTTPIGMWPETDASPMPPDALAGCRLVFDMIYRPNKTRLLLDAEAVGCKTLNGLDMFVRQATMQFALWTGRTPDRGEAFAFLESEISGDPSPHGSSG